MNIKDIFDFEVDGDFDEEFYERAYPEVLQYFPSATGVVSKRKKYFHHYTCKRGEYCKNAKELETRLFGSEINVANDFDLDFYEQSYPEVAEYFLPAAKLISKKKRLFHHYSTQKGNYCKNLREFEVRLFGSEITVEEDFDEEFYEKNYPEIQNYFLPTAKSISKRKRLFHHFKSNKGKFYKNLKELEIALLGSIINVDQNFDESIYERRHPSSSTYLLPAGRLLPKKKRLFHHKLNHTFEDGLGPGSTKTEERTLSSSEESVKLPKELANIIHLFPFELTELSDVNIRQGGAINSYKKNRTEKVKVFAFGSEDPKIEGIEYLQIRSSVRSGKREYYLLSELIDAAINLGEEDDYIVYTNSDCHIQADFYPNIIKGNYDYIEFFRQEVVNGIVVAKNKDGIDGFAAKRKALAQIQQKLFGQKLVIGAPYWDAIISNIAREHLNNTYQDCTSLYHVKHQPRWSLGALDLGGVLNFETLNNLFQNESIRCRKAEIQSGNLVVRVIDKKCDLVRLKETIMFERFGDHNIPFDFNFLLVEEKTTAAPAKIDDDSIGTTAGTRYFVEPDQVEKTIEKEKRKYERYVILDEGQTLSESTNFKIIPKDKLGIVLAFFGTDPMRVIAVKRALKEFERQTIWKKSKVVFVEMSDREDSSFDFSCSEQVEHIKIIEGPSNRNLFQKECLWNIGAKRILDEVDNLIFIDADTFPQNKRLFAKANRIVGLNPNIVYQLGDCIVTQKENGEITRTQWLWNSFSKLKAHDSYCFNPCGGFAISKKIFKQIDGFNPFGFLYGGDILFLYEIDKRTRRIWDWIINNLRIFNKIPRNLKSDNIIIKNHEGPLIHCWHGDHGERPYHEWGLAFNNMMFKREDIKIDERGLLAWRDEDALNKYKKFYLNRNLITSGSLQKKLYL